MATTNPVARVSAIQGKVFAKSEDGAMRELKLGDPIFEGEILVAAQGAQVELATDDGRQLTLKENEVLTMDAEVVGDAKADTSDSALVSTGDDTNRIIQVINEGGSLDELLEETAAGQVAGGSDGGSTFVRLLRIAEGVDPLGYEYETARSVTIDGGAAGGGVAGVESQSLVTNVQEGPTATPSSSSGNEDSDIGVSLSGTDPDGTVVSVTVTSLPPASQGVLYLADGTTPVVAGVALTAAQAASLVFSPAADFHGSVTIPFTVTDDENNVSTPANEVITVFNVQEGPTATPSSSSGNEDSDIGVSLSGTDPDGTVVSVTVTSLPPASQGVLYLADGTTPVVAGVALTAAQAASLVFSPAADFHGSVTIPFTVTDDENNVSTPANEVITVFNVQEGPTATPSSSSGNEDSDIGVSLSGTDPDGTVVSVTVTSLPPASQGVLYLADGTTPVVAGVALTAAQAASLVFSPAADFHGSVTIPFTVTDDENNVSTPANEVITVFNVQEGPTATPSSSSGNEDSDIGVSLSGTDPDGTVVSVTVTSLPPASQGVLYLADGTTPVVAGVALTAAQAASLVFSPAADFHGSVTIPFTVTDDENNVSTPANEVITVFNVQEGPTATPSSSSGNEDSDIGVSLSGTDPDGTVVSVTVTSLPPASQGVLYLADGTTPVVAGVALTAAQAASLVFSPAADFHGSVTIPFTVTDDENNVSTPANEVITVFNVQEGPTATPSSSSGNEDSDIGVSLSGTDPDGTVVSVTVTSLPPASQGVLYLADGTTPVVAGVALTAAQAASLVFSPAADFHGSVTIPFTVTDDENNVSTPANEVITVFNVQEGPTATPSSSSGNEDSDIGVSLSGTDPDGTVVSVTVTSLPPASQGVLYLADGTTPVVAGVALTAAQAASLVFSPAADFHGSVTIPFTVTDDENNVSTPANEVITVFNVQEGPTATPSSSSGNEDSDIGVSLSGTDPDGTVVSVTVTSLPPASQGVLYLADGTTPVVAGVALTAAQAASLVFSPAADFHGSVTIPFTVTDDENNVSTPANEVITVAPTNDAPVNTLPSTAQITEDTIYVINSTYVRVTDVDGDVLTTKIEMANGTLTLVNMAGVTVTGNGTGSVQIVGLAASINAALNNASFKPLADFNGTINATVTTTDSHGASDVDTIAIAVGAAPDIVSDAAKTNEDTAVTIDVLGNDSFENAGRVITAINTTPIVEGGSAVAVTGGTVALVGGQLVFTPTLNFNGTVPDFFYTVTSGGVTETAKVSVTVDAVNDAPVNTVPGAQSATEDQAKAIVGLSVNDVDGNLASTQLSVAHGALTLSLAGGATISAGANGSGTLTLSGTQAQINAALATVSYKGNADYNGSDSLTIVSRDSAGVPLSDTDTVTINVSAVNDAPATTGGAVTGTEDTALVFTWAQFNVTDVDSSQSSLGVQITSLPADGVLQVYNGSAWVNVTLNQTIAQATIAAGSLRFVPDAHESGSDAFSTSGTGNLRTDYAQFSYRPTDGQNAGSDASMRVDITPVADTPTLTTTNHSVSVFATSWEASDTGLSQNVLNSDGTSTAYTARSTLSGWTRVDSGDTYAGGTNALELWSTGDTMENQAGTQTAINAGTGNGSNWLELNNASSNVQTLGIERSITTTAGYVYDLKLDYAGRLGFGQNYTRIAVLVDGVEVASYAGTSGQTALNWETLHFSFVGTGGSQKITIVTDASQFNANGRGAMLDDITLTESQGALAGNAVNGTKTEIPLSGYITTALTDADTSETLTVSIAGIPAGATIVTTSHPSGYTVVNGLVTLAASELASAKLQLSASFVGDVGLTVTATATDVGGSTASTTQPLNFKVLVGAGDVGAEGSTHTLSASTEVLTAATGLHGEYYGYNETVTAGNNAQSGDTTVGNLQYISGATAIINLREGSAIVGTGQSSSAAASDASWVADNIEYGVDIAVTGNLGSNPNVTVGSAITSGALYNFLGGANSGSDAAQLTATSSFGRTTDSILRMVGSAYFAAGSYDFQVRGDDGFMIMIDGVSVFQYNNNQSPTTRTTTTPINIGEGMHTIEIVYWEQGGNAVFDVDYRLNGTTTWLDFSTDNLAFFQNSAALTLTELQDIIENPSVNGQYLIRTGQEVWGGATADTIIGSEGRDIIHGGAGADTISGGTGADRLEGGAGQDTLTGGLGADTFRWELSDHATSGTVTDTLTDFDARAYTAGGDRLDLRDLLQGESSANLSNYLHFEKSGTNTIVHVSSSGGFSADAHNVGTTFSSGAEDQTIILQGVDLVGSNTLDQQIIQTLLNNGKLVTD